jgi:DNA-directed RNA polymerase subunit RPC12/RpoP
MEIRQVWPGGPFRNYAVNRPNPRWIPYGDGFVSSYVCAACRKDVKGVHQTQDGWMCGECRSSAKCNSRESKKAA